MLDGVAEVSVALPPDKERLKSVASKFPEPPLVLYTFSLNSMLTRLLSADKVVLFMNGKSVEDCSSKTLT